jgi:hypothetical protein
MQTPYWTFRFGLISPSQSIARRVQNEAFLPGAALAGDGEY